MVYRASNDQAQFGLHGTHTAKSTGKSKHIYRQVTSAAVCRLLLPTPAMVPYIPRASVAIVQILADRYIIIYIYRCLIIYIYICIGPPPSALHTKNMFNNKSYGTLAGLWSCLPRSHHHLHLRIQERRYLFGVRTDL